MNTLIDIRPVYESIVKQANIDPKKIRRLEVDATIFCNTVLFARVNGNDKDGYTVQLVNIVKNANGGNS